MVISAHLKLSYFMAKEHDDGKLLTNSRMRTAMLKCTPVPSCVELQTTARGPSLRKKE